MPMSTLVCERCGGSMFVRRRSGRQRKRVTRHRERY
ncbi:Uncharacterised protein [Slackia heliotrinireducens]|nr:Uncharacterised protein [Slackia heliotrinireducens]